MICPSGQGEKGMGLRLCFVWAVRFLSFSLCIWWWRNCFSIFTSNKGNLVLPCNKIIPLSNLNNATLPSLYQLVCAWPSVSTLALPILHMTRMRFNLHAEVAFSMRFQMQPLSYPGYKLLCTSHLWHHKTLFQGVHWSFIRVGTTTGQYLVRVKQEHHFKILWVYIKLSVLIHVSRLVCVMQFLVGCDHEI